MIREARPSDAQEVNRLALEALSRDPYPELELDKARVWKTVLQCLHSKQHFVWVSEDKDGVMKGVLGAIVTPHGFWKHNGALIAMWYCKQPGDGVRLMKRFLEWVDERGNINLIERTSERYEEPAVQRLLRMLGFQEELTHSLMLRKV